MSEIFETGIPVNKWWRLQHSPFGSCSFKDWYVVIRYELEEDGEYHSKDDHWTKKLSFTHVSMVHSPGGAPSGGEIYAVYPLEDAIANGGVTINFPEEFDFQTLHYYSKDSWNGVCGNTYDALPRFNVNYSDEGGAWKASATLSSSGIPDSPGTCRYSYTVKRDRNYDSLWNDPAAKPFSRHLSALELAQMMSPLCLPLRLDGIRLEREELYQTGQSSTFLLQVNSYGYVGDPRGFLPPSYYFVVGALPAFVRRTTIPLLESGVVDYSRAHLNEQYDAAFIAAMYPETP